MLNHIPKPDTALKLSTTGLKVLFDLSMARDLIAASARYDLIFDLINRFSKWLRLDNLYVLATLACYLQM